MEGKSLESRLKTFLKSLKEGKQEELVEDAYTSMKSIQDVDVDNAYSTVTRNIYKRSGRIRTLSLLQRIAAVLFIPLLATSILLYKHNLSNYSVSAKQTIINPSGVRSQVELPDGSIAWLNAESEISYSESFARKERNVELSGEAFFDVKSDPKKPFVVSAGEIAVQVLGTRFNVKNYHDEENIEVSLEEGKINLLSNLDGRQQLTSMVPGMRAVFNHRTSKTLISREKNIGQYSAWQRGKLVFDDSPFPQVIKSLERWYSVQIDIKSDEIEQYRLTTTFEEQTIRQVIEILEISSPITIDYTPIQQDQNGQLKNKPQLTIYKKSQ
ncbi:MAG: FecR family protein [Bacteroidales bacterium]